MRVAPNPLSLSESMLGLRGITGASSGAGSERLPSSAFRGRGSGGACDSPPVAESKRLNCVASPACTGCWLFVVIGVTKSLRVDGMRKSTLAVIFLPRKVSRLLRARKSCVFRTQDPLRDLSELGGET